MPRRPVGQSLPVRLRAARTRAGLTQGQTAEKCDVAVETISRIERGKLAPSAELIGKLAAGLNVTADSLLDLPPLTVRPAVAELIAIVDQLDDEEVTAIRHVIEVFMKFGQHSAPRKKPT